MLPVAFCLLPCTHWLQTRKGVYLLHKLLAFLSTRPPRSACSSTITLFGDTDTLVTVYIHHTYVHTSPILAWVVGQCDVVSAPRSCVLLRGVPSAGRPIGRATILATDLECALLTCHLSVWAEIYCFRSALEVLLFSPRLPTSNAWWTRYALVSGSFPFLAWHSPTNPSPDLEASGLRRLKRRGSRPVHFEQVERKRCGSHRHIQAAAHQACTARWCREQLNAANLHISYAYASTI